VHHAGAQAGQLEHFVVADLAMRRASGTTRGIGRVDAVDVGVDLAGVGLQHRGQATAVVSLPPRPSVVMLKFSSIPWKPAAMTMLPSSSSSRTRSVEIDLIRALVCELSVRMPIWPPVRLTAS
jgi:hypothetical protein